MTNCSNAYFLKEVNYFHYMQMKIKDGRMKEKKVIQKSKGRQSCIEGYFSYKQFSV